MLVASQQRTISAIVLFIVLLHLGVSTGCATYAKRVQAPRTAFFANDLVNCQQQLEKLASSHRGDRDCFELDLSIVDLADGNSKSAEERLRKVQKRFDFLEQDSVTEKATSYLTDERSRSYAGEDYERILLRAFLALSNMMHDGGDAESYSLQLDEKQRDIYAAATERLGEEKIQQYPLVPVGYYLRGLLREATFHDYDEAATNYERVCELYPDVRSFAWDLHRARTSVHSQPGKGVLYIFALVGRGPQKIAVSERPTSDALLIADRIISAAGPYKLPPTIAPIQVPAIQTTSTPIERMLVSVDRNSIGPTEVIADIEGMAIGAYQLDHPHILARAVARRVVKKATIVVAKDTMHTDPLVSLAMDAAGVAWEATEAADTRSWSLLPRSIQVLRVEVPVGTHLIALRPLQNNRPIGAEAVQRVEIRNGSNTFVLGYFPDDRLVGKLSVSQPK